MNRWGLGALFWLLLIAPEVLAQPTTRPCVTVGTVCAPVSASNPMPVSGTVTAGGTQDTNLIQVNGAATATGAGTATGALRVELPTNGTGVIAIGNAYVSSSGTLSIRFVTSVLGNVALGSLTYRVTVFR